MLQNISKTTPLKCFATTQLNVIVMQIWNVTFSRIKTAEHWRWTPISLCGFHVTESALKDGCTNTESCIQIVESSINSRIVQITLPHTNRQRQIGQRRGPEGTGACLLVGRKVSTRLIKCITLDFGRVLRNRLESLANRCINLGLLIHTTNWSRRNSDLSVIINVLVTSFPVGQRNETSDFVFKQQSRRNLNRLIA